ncbi:MAG: hypothetical protein K1W28_18100 [Lachnospiraceae bacterium]
MNSGLYLETKKMEEHFNQAQQFFATEDYSVVQHLIGYGIIRKVDDYYDFQTGVIKEYILHKENVNKKRMTRDEKWTHLCTRRDDFEIEMRKMINQEDFLHTMNILNVEGRFDSHAKVPDEKDIVLFNAAIGKLEKIIAEFKKIME